MFKIRCFTIIVLIISHAGILSAAVNILLKFKENTPETAQKNIISLSTPSAIALMEEISVWRLKFHSAPEALKAVKFFNGFDETKYCYKSRRIRAFAPNDPKYVDTSQWGLNGANGINMDQAWNIEGSSGSAYITIAVIDTGVDYNHEDLSSKMWISPQGYHGYDFVNNDNDPLDDNGHGTHVSGIAAAATNNGTGIAGVSINSRIMALKILDSSGTGDEADEAEAILWAVRNGARVINLSLGADSYSSAEADACAYAFNNGVFIAAATGNGGGDGIGDPHVMYPAALSTTFAVGAVNSSGSKAVFSNYGPNLDVLAPGTGILSTVPNSNPGGAGNDAWDMWNISGYLNEPGTSMACPFAAGLASIVLSVRPDYGPGDVAEAIRRSGSDYPAFTSERGYGIINAKTCIENLNAHLAAISQKVTVFPNPLKVNSGVTLKFAFSPAPSSVNAVRIFDFAGQEIIKLDQSAYYPSSQLVSWNGKNSRGENVAQGIYFYFAETDIGQSKGHFAVIK
ncbi:MAG: S8 family serine peptidase [Elusimicrobiota bacterium]|nr:S8 family serine peptidase [Elusimicrobiota bacterium]